MMTDTRDLLTVVTPTLGHSNGHLNRMMMDLRAFTRLPFRQLVSDDGTLSADEQRWQREVTHSYAGAEWTENPGPVWGVGTNLNHAFSLVRTPWVFLVEDGLRPGRGWLETACDLVERVASRRWRGHPVGMVGTASLNDWHLALAGVLPTSLGVMDFLRRTTAECYSAFWGGEKWPNWNDGLWCWKRLAPLWQRACWSPESEAWPREPAPWNFVHLVRHGRLPEGEPAAERLPHVGSFVDADAGRLDDAIRRTAFDCWPCRRACGPAWFPGAFMLVNVDAWRACGGWSPTCPFFEGHLGVRMAQRGYLSLFAEFPPWLHFGGMGFIAGPHKGKAPRRHDATDGDGPDDVLFRDFGRNGPSHADLYGIVYEHFPREEQAAVAQELAAVDLYMDDAWKEWR